MPDSSNLATPLAGNANMRAIVQVAREELERIDMSRLLIYMFETVDESLLDILAAQFDMLGFNGWILADSVQAKRDLLKGAFDLHTLKGTPGGIREVINRLGFLGARIEEGWENFSNTMPEPAINSWAYFRVVYDLPVSRSIDSALLKKLSGLIDNYKNARSILADFSLNLPNTDYLHMRGVVTMKTIRVSDNQVLSEETITNWIHPGATSHMLNMFRKKSEEEREIGARRINNIRFGTNGAVQQPSVNQADLTITDPYSKELDPNPNPVPNSNTTQSVVFNGGDNANGPTMRHFFSLGAGEANGKTIRELGLIVAYELNPVPATEVVFSRINRSPITKTADIRLEGYWDIYITANVPV